MVFDSIIIGAGFAGIGAAIQLKNSGLNNFIVLERKDEIGGPGATTPIQVVPATSPLIYTLTHLNLIQIGRSLFLPMMKF